MLEHLQARGMTHRGIRPDNVFQGAPGQPVMFGPCWATPPAMAQPALFEPPYSAMCLPAGRGDGSIADDVYALGVLLLCLALGRAPLAQLDDAAILRRKLELGTYAALAGDQRLPPIIGDLVRGMLAEDPEHRPTATLLLDPASARGRRVAARPPRRAQRPIIIAGSEVWDARSLAYALAREPDHGLNAVRGNAVEQWLRRGLADAQLAARVEELVRHRGLDRATNDGDGEAELVMRVIAVLDPLAPLCWRGVALWPDGIGTALAAAQGSDPDAVAWIEEIILREETGNWAALRADRCDVAVLRVEARQQHSWLQQRGQGAGVPRLTYLLNPMMPCASPLLDGRWVARLSDLLPALEETAGRVDHRQTEPVDAHVAAFISARLERRMDNDLSAQTGGWRRGGCLHGAASRAGAVAVATAPPAAAGDGRLVRRARRVGAGGLEESRASRRGGGTAAGADAGGLSPADAADARGSGRTQRRCAGGARGSGGTGANRHGTGADRRRCTRSGGHGSTPGPGDRRRLRARRSGHGARRGGPGLRSAMAKRKAPTPPRSRGNIRRSGCRACCAARW